MDGSRPLAKAPQRHHLVGGPDRYAAREAPEHVVADLVAESEHLAVRRQRTGRVLELGALTFDDVEIEVKRPEEQDREAEIAAEDQRHPARLEALHRGEVRGQKEPGRKRDAEKESVPGPEVTREAEQPFENGKGARRPLEDRRQLKQVGRPPIAAFVASTERRGGHRACPPPARLPRAAWISPGGRRACRFNPYNSRDYTRWWALVTNPPAGQGSFFVRPAASVR